MTKEKAVSLLSQMFLIQFSKEEHEALAMAISALNAAAPQSEKCVGNKATLTLNNGVAKVKLQTEREDE